MNASQCQFIKDLAASKGVTLRETFGYNYQITYADGSTYDGPYYDCLKALGHFATVN